ncbi:MAG: GntR family transcriptional regulator [Opitutales bacterium]|nr:GntR family transcriptional regulator [Opitutales bacterium]MDG1326128.1 GntR family transcriptional regulator [Opitutales bacterium]
MTEHQVQTKYTREKICNILRSDLIAGKFNHDQPMREISLAKRFGVSRGPIRDAFLKLTQEGSLVYETNRGVRVHSAIADEERKIMMNMRLDLEKYCISKYIDEADQKDHGELEVLLEQFKSACLRDSLPAVAESDLALHRHWVTRVSKNLEPIWLGLAVRILMKYSRLENIEESIGEHERIVEAIVVKNKERALQALASNLI